jgi:hypothetical protein
MVCGGRWWTVVVGDGELAIHDFSGRSLEASFGYRELRGVRVT